jgi:hypothetical protein
MAAPIAINKNIPYWSQYDRCQEYIRDNTTNCSFPGRNISFLPNSAISTLATPANILALIVQDLELKGLDPFRTTARKY